jgi:predicted dithiol-disulfide oxidoreductase (DUF899 family)
MTAGMHLPEVVSPEEWLAVRRELLAKEKELTRARDRVNADRRRLPMVRIDKPYAFEGPDGTVGLLDLFEGRQQLVMHHFMWINDTDADGTEHPRDTGCPSCSSAADQLRLPRHPRRPGRAGAAPLPHRSRARQGRNTVDGRTVDGEHARRRIAGHQRVPAGR